jgi:hypothetical protein
MQRWTEHEGKTLRPNPTPGVFKSVSVRPVAAASDCMPSFSPNHPTFWTYQTEKTRPIGFLLLAFIHSFIAVLKMPCN